MNTPKCHRCGADLVQIKLTDDSEVGWYCVGCDSDLIGETEEAPTKIDRNSNLTQLHMVFALKYRTHLRSIHSPV